MRRVLLALFLLAGLAACGGADNKWASDEAVSQAAYRHPGPATLSLFTVISNRTGGGAHSALMINGHERVMFDPAGSWVHPRLPERHDVIYGITDPAVDYYIDYHARITYHVIRHDIEISPELAELAIRLVEQNGPVSKAHCASSVGQILRKLPGFEDAPTGFSPKKIMNYFAAKEGVREEKFYDDDPHLNNTIVATGI